MSLDKGNFLSNFRFNNVTGALTPADIINERQFVKEFEEFPTYYGFNLIETPRTDIMGITEVKRISDGQIFTHTNLSSVGTTEYFFDYTNENPTLFFHASNTDEEFAIKYSGIGAAANAKNLLDISLLAAEMSRGLSSKFKRANTYDKIINGAYVSLLGKRATMRNCLTQNTNTIRGDVDGLTSFFEIYGDLTLERDSVINTAGVVFIVHGSLKVSGVGAPPRIASIDGNSPLSAPTSGTVGTSISETNVYPNGGNGGIGALKLIEAPSGYNFGGNGGGGGGGSGLSLSGYVLFNPGYGGNPDGQNGVVYPDTFSGAGLGGGGAAGGQGNLLFAAGDNGQAGATGTSDGTRPIGGNGGAGAGNGGASIFLIVFGEIDPEIEFWQGDCMTNSPSSHCGWLNLVSNYSSIPNTLRFPSNIQYLSLKDCSDINEHLLTEYGYFTAGSISI